MTVKKFFVGLTVVIIVLVLFSGWYVIRYSMNPVEAYEIYPEDYTERVLIATQGSKYKNSLVERVVEDLQQKPVGIKVMDVTELSSIDPNDWKAIIIIHTWEIYEPPAAVSTFIDTSYDANKMFVVATSGDGNNQIEGVDGITGASMLEEVPEHAEAILQFIYKRLTSNQNTEPEIN